MDKLQTIEQFIDDRNAHGLGYESYRGFLQRVNAEKYDEERCRGAFELCERILKLKHEQGVWIDMHNYVDQDIIGVADGIGDSFKLAVMAHVNTTAEVKALSDVCCTSRNAVTIAKKLPNRTIMFVPDENLGREVARQLGELPLQYSHLQSALPQKRIVDQHGEANFLLWQGHCYVHQDINPDLVHQLKEAYPGIAVLAHPECTPDVLRLIDSDKILSTEGMIQYVRKAPDAKFALLTSCGLPELIRAELPPGKEILFDFGACRHCQFMARIKLEDILRVLEDEREAARNEIHLDAEILEKARIPLERMIELSRN